MILIKNCTVLTTKLVISGADVKSTTNNHQ